MSSRGHKKLRQKDSDYTEPEPSHSHDKGAVGEEHKSGTKSKSSKELLPGKQEEPGTTDSNSEDSSSQATLRAHRNESMSDTSPDISLSSQHTLRYSDVEPQLTEHDRSCESSDSIETLDEPSSQRVSSSFNQSFLQHLTITPGLSISSGESGGDCVVDNSESPDVFPEFSNVSRPESLSLSRSTSEQKPSESDSVPTNTRTEVGTGGDAAAASSSSTHKPTQPVGILSQQLKESEQQYGSLSQSLPKGTITRKGDMIEFVASDLQAKIQQSSPLSQPDAASSGSRRSSIRSFASASSSTSFATSSGLSQSPSSSLCQASPDDIPPIDASAVAELENHASRVADSLDLMMGNIRNNLHKMSAITIGCQDAYKRSVDITCDSVDGSIKVMYALMAKCEELSASMAPVQQLATQIKEIKRILDLFESQLTDK